MLKTLLVSAIIAMAILSPCKTKAQILDKDLQKLQVAWNLVGAFYVDSVDKSALAEEAIIAMLKKLDPHSVYISAKEVAAMNEPLNGSFEGVGIEFHIMNDTLMVVNTIPGGPSEKVGIKAGDRIIAIDGKTIAGIGLKNSDVFKMLRGPKGTQVSISTLRQGSPQPVVYNVVRDQIPIFSVDAAFMATPGIAYIKINRFAATTYEEFVTALKKLQKNHPKGLILDLRGNGGGYLNAAIDIADEFLENRKLIVYTQGKNSPRRDSYATARGLYQKGPLVVIMDEESASASEIVAGAIQDQDRGLIIGRRTFGKGLVQRPFTLPDGAVMRLTTAKYYTPSGRCIQKPYDQGTDAYQSELRTRLEHGELMHRDSINISKGEAYKTLEKGRTVYAGGGIMPDCFVPADTSMFSKYYRDLVSKGILNKTALKYLDLNRSSIAARHPDFESYKKGFEVNDDLIALIVKNGETEKIKFNETEFKISEQLIRSQLKAIIANNLWNSSAYFEVIDPIVNVYQKAIETLEDKDAYQRLLK